MDLYDQEPELRLLSHLLEGLERRTMVDVGAELGSLAAHMLEAGVTSVHALDPHPDNASAMRARFAADPRVTVHEYAVSDADGSSELHLASGADGQTLTFGHTLLERGATAEIQWQASVPVTLRSLKSLVESEEIPATVGILKIDTEGHDIAVVRGMGTLKADVVMVEHWTDLPNGLGVCPWTAEELFAILRPRGFNHFAFIVHRGEFVTLNWDDATAEQGAMGNLVFLHDSLLERALPSVLECATWCAERTVGVGRMYRRAANERLRMVAGLEQTASDRLLLIHGLEQTASERLELIHTLEQAAEERLALIHELEQVAQERLAALQATTQALRAAELDASEQRIPG